MPDLILIGCPDETTAEDGSCGGQQAAADLLNEPEAVAVIERGPDGRFHVTTTHHEVTTATMWGMFLGEIFGVLFFVLYAGSSLAQWLRGGRAYFDNRFEREARTLAGDQHC